MKPLLSLLLLCTLACADSYNQQILTNLQSKFPAGGGYSVKETAFQALDKSMRLEGSRLQVHPQLATPSFCSSATYLVFLDTIKGLDLKPTVLEQLLYHEEQDGEGIWGRWNANGPGVAKLFHDLKIGENFESYEQARSGDFMKIFWTEHIGKKEFGHLVVYLSHTADTVTFWSSNQPNGYGTKTVPRDKVNWALFSRLTKPKNLKYIPKLPNSDPFLVNMLKQEFTKDQVRAACGVSR